MGVELEIQPQKASYLRYLFMSCCRPGSSKRLQPPRPTTAPAFTSSASTAGAVTASCVRAKQQYER